MNLHHTTVHLLTQAAAIAAIETKGREYGAPAGLADTAKEHSDKGNHAMAAAYYDRANANTLGHSRAAMYERLADDCKRKLDAETRAGIERTRREAFGVK